MQLTAVLPAIALGFVAPAARPLPPADVSFPRESAARWMPHMAAAGSVGAAEKAVEAAPPPIVPRNFVKVKGEILTPYGVLLGVSVYAVAFLVQIPVLLTFLYSKLFDPKRRRAVDWVIHFWAWASMTMCGYVPEVVGLENLPKSNALFVPNHTSFLDILTLTGFIPKPMKYVSKSFILKIPLIGWPMRLAGHIALRTESRRSQLETYKNTVAALQDGNSVITFPEGTRSDNGRLLPFKRGPFKMAIASGTPIVPVTISGLSRWYPKGTLLPIGVPKGVRVVIHPVVEVVDSGLSEEELTKMVYATINAELPEYQQAAAGQAVISS